MTNVTLWNATFEYSIARIDDNLATLEDFPELCTGERWSLVPKSTPRPMYWVMGFWVGLLWFAYARTQDSKFEAAARQWAARMAWTKDKPDTHDLGFMFMPSHVIGAQLTGDTSLNANALTAAQTLLKRYNAKGGYLQAWGANDGSFDQRGRMIVDTMMNLALLYWATSQTGDPAYANAAAHHAHTSRFVLMRRDVSSAHVGDFNPNSGAFLRNNTHQGYHHDSCWSRGQAWTVYGFAQSFQATGDEAFRAAAIRAAEYAIVHAPGDAVPYWDYDHPDIPNTYRDTSAAAVLASGLLTLATLDPSRAAHWQQHAETIITSLWEGYSSRGTTLPAILQQGTRSVPQGLADHGLIYGDYYFVEALLKLTQPQHRLWEPFATS